MCLLGVVQHACVLRFVTERPARTRQDASVLMDHQSNAGVVKVSHGTAAAASLYELLALALGAILLRHSSSEKSSNNFATRNFLSTYYV